MVGTLNRYHHLSEIVLLLIIILNIPSFQWCFVIVPVQSYRIYAAALSFCYRFQSFYKNQKKKKHEFLQIADFFFAFYTPIDFLQPVGEFGPYSACGDRTIFQEGRNDFSLVRYSVFLGLGSILIPKWHRLCWGVDRRPTWVPRQRQKEPAKNLCGGYEKQYYGTRVSRANCRVGFHASRDSEGSHYGVGIPEEHYSKGRSGRSREQCGRGMDEL